jgi:hypothetical protein
MIDAIKHLDLSTMHENCSRFIAVANSDLTLLAARLVGFVSNSGNPVNASGTKKNLHPGFFLLPAFVQKAIRVTTTKIESASL